MYSKVPNEVISLTCQRYSTANATTADRSRQQAKREKRHEH